MEEKLKQIKSSCKRVVLYGPESTGKTTLAKKLSNHYNVPWVPEFARDYLQKIWDEEKRVCEPKDLLHIAMGQMRAENEMIKKSDSLLICDTNLFETMVYSKYYYDGICDPLLEKYALENSYDLYLLTNIDIPWVKDDLRDKPHEREESFQIFEEELEKNNIPFKIVEGDFEKRFNICKKHIDQLIKDV